MKLELTKEQVDNILTFLQRTNLQGNEVPAYIELLNALQQAKQGGVSKKQK